MMTKADEGGGGVSQMLTIADGGGRGGVGTPVFGWRNMWTAPIAQQYARDMVQLLLDSVFACGQSDLVR